MALQNLRETSIMLSFSVLPDPRKSRNQTYSLFDIITVTVLAVLCGADDWVEVSFWGEANQFWLEKRGICPNGIPSHDTLSHFFRFVDPNAFEKCFINWTQRIAKVVGGVIALDGKTICNSGCGEDLALKGNQNSLHAEAENFFNQALQVTSEEASRDHYVNEEKSRGRHEIQDVWVTNQLDWLPQKEHWHGLNSLICLKSTRVI